MQLQVTIEATDVQGQKSNPTALEMAASLTFAHRLINKALIERIGKQEYDRYGEPTVNTEPALVNLHITAVGEGSVTLNGTVEAAKNPTFDGITDKILANLLTPGIRTMALATKRAFMRASRASAGRTLTVTIEGNGVILRAHCRYEYDQRTEISMREENR